MKKEEKAAAIVAKFQAELAVKRYNAESMANSLKLNTEFYEDIKDISANMNSILEYMESTQAKDDLKFIETNIDFMVGDLEYLAREATEMWDKHYKEQTTNNK
jgi:hypothetical protein